MEVERREILTTPVILKFGFAVAVSFGGVLYTYLRIKRIYPPQPNPSHSPGNENQDDPTIESTVELRDDIDHALQNVPPKRVPSHGSIHSSNGDKESFIFLPELNDLEKECTMSVSTDHICLNSLIDMEYKCSERKEHEREIKKLQNEVKILQEKERNLELQLLEYYGIQEQGTAVMELQNQLKLNTMETKLYNLKIESLLLDNRRLEAQVADYANAANELEAAKAKIKILRKKLKFEVERNREQIMKLQDRVMHLQEHEKKVVEIHQERETLKSRLEEMRICNQVLKQENSDLAQKLDYVKMIAPNALDEELLQLREESRILKQQNEDSRTKIERLQDDRCRNLEELVYLRWINACLRHELRNYHPEGGKSIASLSPRMEDAAKKLILEYANNEGPGTGLLGKTPDSIYTESDNWSPSQASCVTDEHEEPPVKPSKKKLFSKLRRLLRGKSSTAHTPCRAPPLERTPSVENIPGRLSCEFPSEGEEAPKNGRILSRTASRRSFDIPRSYSRGAKGGSTTCSPGAASVISRIEALTAYDNNWSPGGFQPSEEQTPAKEDLLKFAEALNSCRPKSARHSLSYESS